MNINKQKESKYLSDSIIQAVFHYFTFSKSFNSKDNYSYVTDVDTKGERGHINCLKSRN